MNILKLLICDKIFFVVMDLSVVYSGLTVKYRIMKTNFIL